jgi:transposase
VIARHANGADIADIARTVGVSRTTVYRYLRHGPPERKRPSRPPGLRVIAPWGPYLLRRWEEGCHTATRLWMEIRERGFAHSVTTVQRFVVQLRRSGPEAGIQGRSAFTGPRGPSARRVASLILQRAEQRTAVQQAYLERLSRGDPAIATAARLTDRFLTLLRQRQGGQLEAWLVEAQQSAVDDLRRFACGLQEDRAAVQAGLTLDYSNGQTEGQITRLKLVRRTMYGRGSFELLRQRLLGAA